MIVQRICKTIMKLELFSVEILLIAAAKPKKVVFLIETQMELLIQEIICFCLCQKAIDNQTTNAKETFSITLLNPNYDDSQFLENKINNIFDKRDNLDADPLIQEIRAVPRTLSKLDELRARIVPGSGDMLLFAWDERDENGDYAVTYELRVKDSGIELMNLITTPMIHQKTAERW